MLTRIRRLIPRRPAVADPAELRTVEDGQPRDAFFAAPLVVTDLRASVEAMQDEDKATTPHRVSFLATVRDAEGKRCPEMAVHARVAGPHRSATGMGHTSMLGQVTFRMSGPAGVYTCTIEDVAGGALGLDTEASTLTATIDTSSQPAVQPA